MTVLYAIDEHPRSRIGLYTFTERLSSVREASYGDQSTVLPEMDIAVTRNIYPISIPIRSQVLLASTVQAMKPTKRHSI